MFIFESSGMCTFMVCLLLNKIECSVWIMFLAHQTSFSVIFTSADKSYLTYPNLMRGID